MAINKTINKRTNTHGAMRNCIEYVLRQDKTGELLTYVTGPYCHDEINYDLVYSLPPRCTDSRRGKYGSLYLRNR